MVGPATFFYKFVSLQPETLIKADSATGTALGDFRIFQPFHFFCKIYKLTQNAPVVKQQYSYLTH